MYTRVPFTSSPWFFYGLDDSDIPSTIPTSTRIVALRNDKDALQLNRSLLEILTATLHRPSFHRRIASLCLNHYFCCMPELCHDWTVAPTRHQPQRLLPESCKHVVTVTPSTTAVNDQSVPISATNFDHG